MTQQVPEDLALEARAALQLPDFLARQIQVLAAVGLDSAAVLWAVLEAPEL
jgi:hypothetical protein